VVFRNKRVRDSDLLQKISVRKPILNPARVIFEKNHWSLLSSTAQLGSAKIALAQLFSFIFFKNE
jgi:hypothetical protein